MPELPAPVTGTQGVYKTEKTCMILVACVIQKVQSKKGEKKKEDDQFRKRRSKTRKEKKAKTGQGDSDRHEHKLKAKKISDVASGGITTVMMDAATMLICPKLHFREGEWRASTLSWALHLEG